MAGLMFALIISLAADKIAEKISEYKSSRSENVSSDVELDKKPEDNTDVVRPSQPVVEDSEAQAIHKPFSNFSLAVNILISDGIHNFIDGILIGVTFHESVTVGFTTSVAIMLHEIPQEIADFKLLVQSGFTVKKAFVANLICACTSIIGALIGAGVSEGAEDFANHFLPIAAGIFIYIALAEVIPEIRKHLHTSRDKLIFLGSSIVGMGIILGLTYLPWKHAHESSAAGVEHAH
jgi:zinc transporter ZupT